MLSHYLNYAGYALSILPTAAFWLSSNKTSQFRSIRGRKESAPQFPREERGETRLEIAIRR